MNRLLHILFFFIIISIPLSGQKIVPTPDDLYSDAVEFMNSGDHFDALLILLNLRDRGYNTTNINFRIGECYLNIQGQKQKSISFLEEAIKGISVQYIGSTLQEEFAPVKALLYLGIACRLEYNFECALKYFNEYLQTVGDTDKDNVRLAEYHIERCNYARELMEAPALFTADTLPDGINSSVSNFNPLVTVDEKAIYWMDQMKFYDAVMHTMKTDQIWAMPENLTPLIKSDGDHYTTGISAEGNQIFLTSYDPYLTGELYSTKFENGMWTEMLKLNANINTVFNETHATLSPDGMMLYFTSDRKGGYGGLDIYRSEKNNNGEWMKPVNLGPLINSPYNEESPFISSDGSKLFFSSQGHYNMGGYDVFYSSVDDNGKWLPPVNIGYPLNTTDDDLFYFPLDSGYTAYQARFSSITARQDLVRYTVKAYGRPARFILNGKIDLKTGSDSNPPSISVAFIDKNAGDTLASQWLNEDGTFRQKLSGGRYQLDFSDNTQTLLSRELEIPDYFPHNNLVFHDEIIVPVPIGNEIIQAGPIRFEFNSNMPEERYLKSLEDLANLMKKYPGINLHLCGYADALGSDLYNIKLSMKRAISVKAYLSKQVGLSERITLEAFGEKNPVAVNMNADGSDNPEGRSYNRRVEIIFDNIPDNLEIIRINDIPEAIRLR